MKRTAGAFMLLASLGGCMSTQKPSTPLGGVKDKDNVGAIRTVPGVQGPWGQPVTVTQQQAMARPNPAFMQASYVNPTPGNPNPNNSIVLTGGMLQSGTGGCATCGNNAGGGNPIGGQGGPIMQGQDTPYQRQLPNWYPGAGILPVPQMGPFGAVAAQSALPALGGQIPVNARTSIRFSDPAGMKVTWAVPTGWNESQLETPARYNFPQGGIYRLKLSGIQNRPGLELYPTLEVLPSNQKSATFLAHSSVPVSFSEEDFEQVVAGNFLVKVIYLPDPQYQDLSTVAGPNEVNSARLEPGVNPVVEAQKRGTILLIVRMGNIDLQAPGTPAMDAPNPYLQGMMPPRGIIPPPVNVPPKTPANPIVPMPKSRPTTLP